MRFALLVLLLAPLVCLAGEKEESAIMNRWLTDVRAILPAGWEADLRVERGTLQMVVRTSQKIKVWHNPPNGPGRDKDEQPNDGVCEFYYAVRPFLTPQEYIQARAKNDSYEARRQAFMDQHLKKVRWGHMGPKPLPPTAYKPANEQERELVRQYAILWANTEPVDLPTHYRDSVALWFWDYDYTSPAEESRQKELQAIQDAVERMLTKYEAPKKG